MRVSRFISSHTAKGDSATAADPDHLLHLLEIPGTDPEDLAQHLPFSERDTSVGVENEFQAVVIGKKENLDLAVTIEESNYYKNILRRSASGDMSKKTVVGLERYLEEKESKVWENSWVRFPQNALSKYANHIFRSDLQSDKAVPGSKLRSDAHRFTFEKDGQSFLRIPVSYLLKLALADVLDRDAGLHPFIRITGEEMMAHFSNDNTSPEIFSFYPVKSVSSSESAGKEAARETLIRFLLTQLIIAYAEHQFKLKDHGQQVRVYFSASPPFMQKQLNNCISDEFYRHLFMSPCLSGWSRGEEKHDYMKLCHKVLSRSQINGISKLKEAGIITSNLVVLPNNSNISLANNGTHISIGSAKLGRLLKDKASGFTPAHEKYIGDLAIKITEHFLCLFPGIYSASPYRLDFKDFHPETVLGFLPHEIDYTHLRMIWRRWKRKAKISILGNPITPFGPVLVDRFLSRIFGLKGDFLPDYRLVDYFVSLMSTDESPALNGQIGNGDRLKHDLSQMGIFDSRMPLYQLVRLREASQMGYSGFEHRYFSIFERIMFDMRYAADLQNLITALAYQYILSGKVTHAMIPDTTDIESERRQIFFAGAIDLPTFFVKTKTENLFLRQILRRVKRTRFSRRYAGYTRIRMIDYKTALIEMIRDDGRDLIQSLRLQGLLTDLESRICSPKDKSTAGKLTAGILAGSDKKGAMKLNGEVFNKRAEQFYIQDLRDRQIREGFTELETEFKALELWAGYRDSSYNQALHTVLKDMDLTRFLKTARTRFTEGRLEQSDLKKLIYLIILYVRKKKKAFSDK